MNLPSNAEPSDILWHPRLNELFVVSDNGWVFRMSTEGSVTQSWFLGGDLEGVCVAQPESNFIYVAIEVPYRIYEFDFEHGIVTRIFDLGAWIQTPANQGIEALTYIPASGTGAPGRFLVGLQFDGSIHEFNLPISSPSTQVIPLGVWTPVPGRTDLAAMAYEPGSNVLYLVYDYADLLRAVRPNGDFINEWVLPGEEQEGIALEIRSCSLFVAEDTGPVWRFSDFPAMDSDIDGVPDCMDRCPDTPPRSAVNASGCSCLQLDEDYDGVDDCDDWCDDTPWPETADWRGCSCSQRDTDGDGVNDCADACPETRPNTHVDGHGCPIPVRPTSDVDQSLPIVEGHDFSD